MVARYPALIKPGSKLDYFALSVDIAPTMLDLAGVRAPKEVRGHSVVPLFKGNTKAWRRSLFTEYYAEPNFPRIPSYHCVRGERWKYTRYLELPDADELYDIQADPYEMNNRAKDTATQDVAREMRRELERQFKETA